MKIQNVKNLHYDLRITLERLEWEGYTIVITSAHRELDEHLQIYRDIAKRKGVEFNINDVPLKSRHLPTHKTNLLRAVDFKAYRKSDGRLEDPEKIKWWILSIQKQLNEGVFYGIGTGSTFTHLDIDRDKNAFWGY